MAVKVQYSDLRERFESDVGTCAAILDLIEVKSFYPKNFVRLIQDIIGTISYSNLVFFSFTSDHASTFFVSLAIG